MTNLLACDWAPSHYFFFSENVFDPLIYYSHLGPILASLALFFFIFFANRRDFLNRLLLGIILFFCTWSLLDLFLWASEVSQNIMFVWSIMVFFEAGIYFLCYYFVAYFIRKRDLSFWSKFLLLLPILPLIYFASTHYNLEYFDLTNCDREALEGLLWTYTYFFEGFYVFLIFLELLRALVLEAYRGRKKEIFAVCMGILLFLGFFSWGNIIGSLSSDWSVAQYGLFGMPIFIAFLAYSIVRYQTLQIKTLAVQVLVAAITILVGAQFFFVRTPLNRALTFLTLVCILVFGYMLVQSVKREVKRKEELQRISDSLARANERLKELDQSKTEFISIASHQLRTPLTAIKGYISLMLEGSYGPVPPALQDTLNKLYSVNDRLINLVEDLLNVSRIEAGRIQYTFEETQIEPLVADLVDSFKLAAKNKKLELTLSLPKRGLPKILVDPNKTKEVLSNLIDNALKYTKEGSVSVSVEQNGEFVRIAVQDTGIGMKPEDKEHLFEKFVRSKETTRMVVSGAGLGLFVGKNFIKAQGGAIWAESDGPGKGSTFFVELPIKNTSVQAGTVEKPNE